MNTSSPLIPEIDFRNISPRKRIVDVIHRRTNKLQGLFDGVLRCRVRLDVPHRRHRIGNQGSVHLEINVPDDTLIVDRVRGPDLLTTIQDAFDAAERQVQAYARRRRGEVKTHEEEYLLGTVQEIQPLGGYGFVGGEDGVRVYFDRNSVLNEDFAQMQVGQKVRYLRAMGEKGPQASTLYVL